MEKVLNSVKKLIPKKIFEFLQPAYHWILGYAGAFVYGFPSKDMVVIGVTGTKGKTTTCNLIHHLLQSSGFETGLSTTVNFKIGTKEWTNELKQTMPGRFYLQKTLWRMKKAGCRYAVVETSSEGILQYRHRFIDYDVAVFLNLSPEHLERHKGFDNYRAAKVQLFKRVALKTGGVGVYNIDDEHVVSFLEPGITKKMGYRVTGKKTGDLGVRGTENFEKIIEAAVKELTPKKAVFAVEGIDFSMNLIGEFNVYNAAAAIAVCVSQKIPIEQLQQGLASFKAVSGRMEVVDEGQSFSVIVDYAHEPKSLESVYRAVTDSGLRHKNGKLICLLGSAGGGRDKWKRPLMGKIAATYCDEIFLTNEDPYDEDPEDIIAEVKEGIDHASFPVSNLHLIVDRRRAIEKAFSLAKKGDAVVLTGKGGEVWMCVENGRKIPWNEKNIVKEIIKS